jgi:hypothetical protein
VVLIRILDVNVGFMLQVSERSVAGSYIQRLAPMFDLPAEGDEVGWSAQKVANVHCMLQVGALQPSIRVRILNRLPQEETGLLGPI